MIKSKKLYGSQYKKAICQNLLILISQIRKLGVLMLDTVENDYQTISVKRFAPNLGAEISGVDLSKDITDAQFSEILTAFHDHQVLFFKDQKEISPEMQVIFGTAIW